MGRDEGWAALSLAVSLSLILCASAVHAVTPNPNPTRQLQLEEPQELLRSDGGRVEAWRSSRALEDAHLGAVRVTIRERGLLLPRYVNVPILVYVQEGEGVVGLLSGYSLTEYSRVRHMRRGDVVAMPQGVAVWMYNSGSSDLRLLAIGQGDSFSSGVVRGEETIQPFFLAGGRKEGEEYASVLHGFDTEFLADAWDIDESRVKELLRRQEGVGIVRVEQGIEIPVDANSAQDNSAHHSTYSGEFVYNVRDGRPEARVQEAGSYNLVDRFKLPILKDVGLGLSFGRLERNAIFAPSWSSTGHALVHFLRGSGWLEIVGNSGEQLLNKQVREGESYFSPLFLPHGLQAGEEGLEWIAFYSTDQPQLEALAGSTSVLSKLPEEVAAVAFNVDVTRIREARQRSVHRDALILPARRRSV